MARDFSDTTVILTGASMGVGAATARAFAAQNANLVLIARGRDKLDALAAELERDFGNRERVMVEALDVTDLDGFGALLARVRERFGGIDVLVNNAGFHARGPVERVSAEDIGRMIDVNLKAPLMATRMLLPDLRRSMRPAVINVASLAGRTPVPGSASYSASKFGLRAFGLALAEELRGSGIRIASVSPGPIDTGFIMDDIDAVSDLTFSQPISTAEEVAEAIVALVDGGALDLPLPRISGYLTTISYLFPALGRALRPMLEKKGRRTKERLKRERERERERERG
jgi:short-subunit dehydrogenase